MTAISKPELLVRIIDAVHDSGWDLLFVSQTHPFKIIVFRGDESYRLNIYIWNLTHGGGYMRPANEYRIQAKVTHGLQLEIGSVNLLLGWWEDGQVFAGFDVRKHLEPGWSASIQIRIEALRSAYQNGFATSDKGNEEIAISFRKDLFIEYIKHLESLHDFGRYTEDLAILDRAVENLALNDADIMIMDNQRREVVTAVRRRIRDMSFQNRVLNAYSFRCAFCGVQLKLVDAAHIIPVSDNRSTDQTSNGLSLCALHHRAYDKSLVTVMEDYSISTNERQISTLRRQALIDGLETFRDNLREVVYLPPEVTQRPHVEFIRIANQIRGW